MSTTRNDMPVEKECQRLAAVFSHAKRPGRTGPDPPIPDITDLNDDLRPLPRASYHSCVCSITGDAIERIAEAIDQLDRDAHGVAAEPELTARLAGIWLMMSALDPEIARLQQAYVTPSGGTRH
jgi:hypothetical protein